MPKYKGKHYAYTKEGKKKYEAAKKADARKKKKKGK